MNKFMRLVAVLMVLATVFAFAACTPAGNPTTTGKTEPPATTSKPQQTEPPVTTKPEAKIAFRVKVVDQNGDVVPGVWVQICKDSCRTQMTNEEGWAEFLENANFSFEDGYHANIAWMDNEADEEKFEYNSEETVDFEAGKNELTLVITRK